MRIAFDHQAFCLQKTGGISRYFSRLARTLAEQYPSDTVKIFAPLHRNEYLKDIPTNLIDGCSVLDYPVKTAGLTVAMNGVLSRMKTKMWSPDLVHETYFTTKRSAPKSCPTVLTVFDMIAELSLQNPKLFRSTSLTNKLSSNYSKHVAIRRADLIICISEQTRKDLIQIYQVPENKISVIYLGCDAPLQTFDVDDASKSNRPYLLYVGLREGYKNFNQFLHALASSRRLMTDFDLVCFGGGAFSTSEEELLARLGFRLNQVRHVSGCDHLLNQTYKNATAFIYPSMYEGFGLPPLEAMANSCPVICSQVSSVPEVVGSAGRYFDPYSLESMREAIESVVYSSDLASKLIGEGLARIKQFSWERCAQQTHLAYRSLVNHTSGTGIRQ
jgi:glycosyltransferase involved in cell wall biosynthesis